MDNDKMTISVRGVDRGIYYEALRQAKLARKPMGRYISEALAEKNRRVDGQ